MDVIKQIKQWSDNDQNIRAVLLVGSRADGSQVNLDAFSDYDVTLFVKNIPEILAKEEIWKKRFGKILVEIEETGQINKEEHPARLILYKSGIKIDFAICHIDTLKLALTQNELPEWIMNNYEVLIDKEGITAKIDQLKNSDSKSGKPNHKEYQRIVNEFFWEITYISKNLERQEIWLAKYSEWVLREEMLIKMLEWYEKIRNNWDYQIEYNGKGIRHWLNEKKYDQLLKTYTGANINDNWRGLQELIKLFRETAKVVGEKLGYEYPVELEKSVIQYIDDRVSFDLQKGLK